MNAKRKTRDTVVRSISTTRPGGNPAAYLFMAKNFGEGVKCRQDGIGPPAGTQQKISRSTLLREGFSPFGNRSYARGSVCRDRKELRKTKQLTLKTWPT